MKDITQNLLVLFSMNHVTSFAKHLCGSSFHLKDPGDQIRIYNINHRTYYISSVLEFISQLGTNTYNSLNQTRIYSPTVKTQLFGIWQRFASICQYYQPI
jgi:hypothetical protein